ncbi:acyltransferase [Arthrobacter sp. ISL-28]|uniref:acyltransferase family protein n=1 Tax=Arthrobacter sp. ISL-28 TaxID=2819108 RepID=UPI001BE593E7|nr:acyltransferase [Arthrobacter sp. ISL-28]MBT2521280.1 acyltransferase [Arthrobacter sp. ISL-28]
MPVLRIQLSSLTGLRFFAAMAVVFYHLHLYFPKITDSLAIFRYGFTGVSFFFILSGFVLTWSHRADVRSGRFYWNRVARIWPLHLLTMILSIWIPMLSASPPADWSAIPFVLTLTQAWIPASGFLNAFNGVSWSLSCEAYFYLLFPLLFRHLSSRPRVAGIAGTVFVALIIVGICLSKYSSIQTANYLLGTMPLYRMGEFVLGMCLAMIMKRGWRPAFRLQHAIGMTALLTVGLFVAPLIVNVMSGPVPVIYANLIMIPGFLALIATAASRDLSASSTVFGSKALVRLGQWSFALYLVHELVIRLARPFLADIPIDGTFGVAVLAVVSSIGLSGVLHEFVEKPAEKWLRSRGAPQTAHTANTVWAHRPEK